MTSIVTEVKKNPREIGHILEGRNKSVRV